MYNSRLLRRWIKMETPLGGALFVALVMLISVAGLVLIRRYADIGWLKRHHDVASFFFLMIGTLYAVLIAFAIFVVWTQFQDAGANLEHEANEIGDLSRMALTMSEPMRSDVRMALANYIHAVLEDEFPAMASDRTSPRTWQAVEQLWMVYADAEPTTLKMQANYEESLRHLNELSDYRRNRLFTMRGTVPKMLWCLLVTGGIMLIAFTYFFGHESLLTQAAMTAALAGILAFSLFLIYAYDSPFSGAARISPLPFQLELQHVMARH
jgi:hypothetical protein